jgi:acetoin utilization deacetylase AcuC-like enzyme
MTTLFIHHPDCRGHDMGPGHPESPQRLDAVSDALIAAGVMTLLEEREAPLVDRECLLRVHDADYLDELEARVPPWGRVQLDPDTAMNAGSLAAAQRAAGAAVLATDLVASGRADNAFCNVRPPGHHALPGRAMGFCFFNSVAVAAAHALAVHGLARVAVVDFDVHHGNGTEAMFAHDPRVMMVSSFQHPFYPHSGVEGRSDTMVNVPLPAGSSGARFREVVEREWLPALARFRPEMLFVSAGFDAHRDDDMASLALVEDDYAWVTRRIMEVAYTHAAGRVVSVLEGGYELDALGRSAVSHVRVLAGL